MGMANKDSFIIKVGEFCKMFRKDYLNMTQKEFAELTGVKVVTLSSFECGRDNNIKFIYLYYLLSLREHKEIYFMQQLFNSFDYCMSDVYVGRGVNNG